MKSLCVSVHWLDKQSNVKTSLWVLGNYKNITKKVTSLGFNDLSLISFEKILSENQ